MKKLLLFLFILAPTIVMGQLSGTKTVGSGGDYSTIAAAISALNGNGVNGPLTFLLTDATYNETGANLLINVLSNPPSSSNPVVFRPNTGVTTTINITGAATTGNGMYAGITVDGTSYITIDGSNTEGGSTRNMTINQNDGANGRYIIQLFGNSDNVVIKNATLLYGQAPASTSTSSFYVNGVSTGVSDSVLIQNCQVANSSYYAAYALYIKGFPTTVYATKIYVRGCTLYGTIRKVYFYYVGTASTTSEFSGNTVIGYAPPTGNVSWGLLLNYYNGTFNIFNNVIANLVQASSGTDGFYGLGTLCGQSSVKLNIYNNMLGGGLDHTGSGTPANIDVISFQDAPAGAVIKVHYNTIVLNSMTKTTTTRMTCMRFNPASGSTFDIKNNIFINDKDATVGFALYFGGTTTTFTSNSNNVYVSGANANIGYSSSAARKALSDWQTATSQDANSKSKAVTFVSSTDLHLSGGSVGDVDLIGETGLGITTDIDGDTRSTNYPYMGADEASIPLPIQLASFIASQDGNGVTLRWITASETNNFGFEIERKNINLKSEISNLQWTKVGFVQGAGTTTSPKEYAFTDNPQSAGRYAYRLKQIDRDGTFKYYGSAEVEIVTAPVKLTLSENYPNPFNPSTTIRFSVPEDGQAVLKVFNVAGQEVGRLFDGIATAGKYYEVMFNASRLSSGVYFYAIQYGNQRLMKKMMLIK
jgi:hypothetical protein